MRRGLNTLQRIIILLWMVALVALAAFPPWTVTETIEVITPKQSEISYKGMHSQGTANWFRWFLAPGQWWVDARLTAGINRGPITNPGIWSHFNGTIRYDLLELFIVSAVAAGLLVGVSRKGGIEDEPARRY
jgi:hypothetical protein